MSAAEVVDGAVTGRVLVFGSLPPGGRDLDLVVRQEELGQLEIALPAAGFRRKGNQWARFGDGETDAIETIPAGDWDLPSGEIDALFARALSLDGFANLVRPTPADSLVILARRFARSGGELDHKKRSRVKQALNEDADAWANAQAIARSWGSYRAVTALERSYKSGVPVSRRKRASALAERNKHARLSAPYLRAWRVVIRRPRGRGLVTFSGLDGSGKTSQAEALRDSLERTTGDTVVVWTRLSYNPSLKALARPFKALLGVGKSRVPDGNSDTEIDVGKELRRRSPLVTLVWATAVALANATSQRRVTRYHLRRGRTVVCDRYTLDSRVHLRYRYGSKRRFALQGRLIEALSPKPVRSYLVDVPADVAYERKAEQYDLEQLRVQANLYKEESDSLAVKKLDGTRPKDDLSGEVAEEVWRAL
jgi:thymidylate kinase